MRRAKLPATAWAVLFVGIGLTVLAACGDGGPTAPAAVPTSHLPVATPEFGRQPIEEDGTGQSLALLVDVHTARQDGFDRVVFEFEDTLPGYRVRYVDPPITEDASDLPVEIQGNAFLRVVLFSATSVDLSGATPRQTCCRNEITTGLPALVDLQDAGDFEAVLTHVLGLSEEVDFRVFELGNPFRLVIDVAHP